VGAVREICEDHGLYLVEDAAHGSKIDGRSANSLGRVGRFSFYLTKVMTTGEGGMIATNSDEMASKTRGRQLRGEVHQNYRGDSLAPPRSTHHTVLLSLRVVYKGRLI